VHGVQEYDLPSAKKKVKSKRPQACPYIDAWTTSRSRLLHGRDHEIIEMANHIHQEKKLVCCHLNPACAYRLLLIQMFRRSLYL
jgi:hypothetical protein